MSATPLFEPLSDLVRAIRELKVLIGECSTPLNKSILWLQRQKLESLKSVIRDFHFSAYGMLGSLKDFRDTGNLESIRRLSAQWQRNDDTFRSATERLKSNSSTTIGRRSLKEQDTLPLFDMGKINVTSKLKHLEFAVGNKNLPEHDLQSYREPADVLIKEIESFNDELIRVRRASKKRHPQLV